MELNLGTGGGGNNGQNPQPPRITSPTSGSTILASIGRIPRLSDGAQPTTIVRLLPPSPNTPHPHPQPFSSPGRSRSPLRDLPEPGAAEATQGCGPLSDWRRVQLAKCGRDPLPEWLPGPGRSLEQRVAAICAFRNADAWRRAEATRERLKRRARPLVALTTYALSDPSMMEIVLESSEEDPLSQPQQPTAPRQQQQQPLRLLPKRKRLISEEDLTFHITDDEEDEKQNKIKDMGGEDDENDGDDPDDKDFVPGGGWLTKPNNAGTGRRSANKGKAVTCTTGTKASKLLANKNAKRTAADDQDNKEAATGNKRRRGNKDPDDVDYETDDDDEVLVLRGPGTSAGSTNAKRQNSTAVVAATVFNIPSDDESENAPSHSRGPTGDSASRRPIPIRVPNPPSYYQLGGVPLAGSIRPTLMASARSQAAAAVVAASKELHPVPCPICGAQLPVHVSMEMHVNSCLDKA